MGTKRRFLITALLLVVCGGLAWMILCRGVPEPVYNGKRLGQWLRQPPGPPFTITVEGGVLRFDFLSSHMPVLDSNAVPYLVKMLGSRDGAIREFYIRSYDKFPRWLQARMRPPASAQLMRYNAVALLAGLGKEARPAVPALARVVEQDDFWTIRCLAIYTIGRVGQGDATANHALVMAFRDKDPEIRLLAAQALKTVDPETAARTQVDVLLNDVSFISK